MSAQRLAYLPTAFRSLGNSKRPREKDAAHLRFVHGLPCLLCGQPGEAAHIRFASIIHGKVETGAGRKPDDKWTVPLCEADHRTGPDAQHGSNEAAWWARHGIDPIAVAALLWAHTGDYDAAVLVCTNAKLIGSSPSHR